MQGTHVLSPVWEDSTQLQSTKPTCHNYCAMLLTPQTGPQEPLVLRPVLTNEKLLWWGEARIRATKAVTSSSKTITAPLAEDILGRYLDPLTNKISTLYSHWWMCLKSIVRLMSFCVCVWITKRLSDSSGVTQQGSSNTETRNQVSYCVPPATLMCIHSRQIHFHIKQCTERQICAHTHTLLSATIHTCFWSSALKK